MSAKEEKAIKRLGISVHISPGSRPKEARFPITEQKNAPESVGSTRRGGKKAGCWLMNDKTVSFSGNCRKVTFYSGGVLLSAGGRYVAGKHQRSKRGEITGWSKSSRRRMRRFMLSTSPRPGMRPLALR